MINKIISLVLFLIISIFFCSCQGSRVNQLPKTSSVKEIRPSGDVIGAHGNVWDARIADIDDDGKLDLICVSKDETVFFVFDILGQKRTLEKRTKCIHPVSLAISDFNNDGKSEVILLTESGIHSYMTVNGTDIIEKELDVSGKNRVGRMWRAHAVNVSDGENRWGIVAGGVRLVYFNNSGQMNLFGREIPGLFYSSEIPVKHNFFRDWQHAFRWISPVEDLNGDGINEVLSLDYPSRTGWVLFSNKKSPAHFKAKRLLSFNYSPLWGTLLKKNPVPNWLIMTDIPGKIWLVKGQAGDKNITTRPILEINNRIAGAACTDFTGDSCKDLIIFAENLIPREHGFIMFYQGICENGDYGLKKIKVINSTLMTTYALTYKEPILAVPGFEKKKVEIYVKGRDF